MTQKITLVTVVYLEELRNLRLQAQSVAAFFEPGDISAIHIIVNDRQQQECKRLVREMVPLYGELADRVRIVEPEEIISKRAGGFAGAVKRAVIHNRDRIPFRVKSGWRGNNGWLMQQAFKLCAARLVPDGFVLILDAKNFFVSKVSRSDFISEEGKALSFLEMPGKAHRKWLKNSFRTFGIPAPSDAAPIPPSTTPYCVRADVLRGCLAGVEEKLGPVQLYFGHKPLVKGAGWKASEFMLIYAYVTQRHGAWPNLFDEGLQPVAGISRKMDDETVDSMITLVENRSRNVFSVHSTRVHNLRPDYRTRIRKILEDRGLAATGSFLFRQEP
ncbi:hypothetical protein KUW17_22655 [Leisingera aquaemixtae]|uniref:DUF6492 family protein n=1 Tax=Leisingera TaxID=191028 RepID=UPI001C947071|nr:MULTISPECIES: DUF6492 family protein [Leisingera]MBY6069555.1 hypothetical protein [Leisingera aquaemixtae]MCB4458419.1 DUF6492 family protein [Leisingera sp. McT4-56]